MEKAIIVSRCSTNESKQDVTRQTNDLSRKFSRVYTIIKSFEYYKSGKANDGELNLILEYAVENNIQHILFTEISRIARKVIDILIFIENCTQNKINVIIDNYNLHSLNIDKTENHITKTMLHIGATFSEIELRQIQNRLNSGRNKYIAEGGRLGRRINTKTSNEKIIEKHKDIKKFVKQGLSVRVIMQLTNKSNGTIQKVKKILQD